MQQANTLAEVVIGSGGQQDSRQVLVVELGPHVQRLVIGPVSIDETKLVYQIDQATITPSPASYPSSLGSRMAFQYPVRQGAAVS